MFQLMIPRLLNFASLSTCLNRLRINLRVIQGVPKFQRKPIRKFHRYGYQSYVPLANSERLGKQLSEPNQLSNTLCRLLVSIRKSLLQVSIAKSSGQNDFQLLELYHSLKERCEAIENSHKQLIELLDLCKQDKTVLPIETELETLLEDADSLLLSSLFYDPIDYSDTYIEIRAGTGGTDACDWTAMLARMYTNWAHSRNYSVETVDKSPTDGAGVKSMTLSVKGPFAFGYAQFESGIHRLVRISPFDRAGNRHTSFASVQVSPQVQESRSSININPSDLEITTTRSQGAGGQHVNKTESAVRILHIPSGIVVSCQKERSQHRNKADAIAMLKGKLYDRERQKLARNKSEAHTNLPENSWGSQIRSYVLNPYQLVKDSRTKHQETNAQVVLDGDVQRFMVAGLRHFRLLE